MLDGLSALVTTEPGGVMTATGVPPHVSTLQQMQRMSVEMQAVRGEIKSIPEETISEVARLLQEHDISVGRVTHDALHEMFDENYTKIIAHIDSRTVPSGGQGSSVAESASVAAPVGFAWRDGTHHRVPEDFTFPKVSTRIAWQHWMCGNTTQGYPPYRHLTPDDMSTPVMRKRLSDFSCIMRAVEDAVRSHRNGELWIEMPSVFQASNMFEVVGFDAVALPAFTDRNRKRRVSELKWNTHLNLFRKKRKQMRNADAPPAVAGHANIS